jgi:hypothetical protein
MPKLKLNLKPPAIAPTAPLKADTHIRQLLQTVRNHPDNLATTLQSQAVGFKHFNADGKLSHISLGTKFRRYGK